MSMCGVLISQCVCVWVKVDGKGVSCCSHTFRQDEVRQILAVREEKYRSSGSQSQGKER